MLNSNSSAGIVHHPVSARPIPVFRNPEEDSKKMGKWLIIGISGVSTMLFLAVLAFRHWPH